MVPMATAAECCAACANDTRCAYATWDAPKNHGGQCYLKPGPVQPPCSAEGHSLCTCPAPAPAPPPPPPPTPAPPAATGTLALLGIANMNRLTPGVRSASGVATKHPANPLFTQTEPWEANVNNGHPTVIYDPEDPLGTFRCWHDDHTVGALAYANSSDGIHWEKPLLNLVDLGGTVGKRNNLVVAGNSIGVLKDLHESNASRRFKAVGALRRHSTSAGGGTIVSADGLHWGSPAPVPFPDPPQRYDTSNNLLWDAGREQYVMTTRRHPTTSPKDADRAIGVVLSARNAFSFAANVSAGVTLIAVGNHDHQLYPRSRSSGGSSTSAS